MTLADSLLNFVPLVVPFAFLVAILIGFAWLSQSARKAAARAEAEGKVVDLICKTCGTKRPATRQPASWQEYWRGGWTCHNCLTTVDRYGIAIPGISGRPASKPAPSWLLAVAKYKIVVTAVFWTFFMWLFMAAGPVSWDFAQGKGFDGPRLMYGLGVCTAGGSLYGLLMWLSQRKRGDQKKAEETSKHF